MASILRIDTPLGGPVSLNGYLPSLGVAGYTRRYRASSLPGAVNTNVPAGTVWSNDVGTGGLAVKMSNTTTTPKIEDVGTTRVVAFPFGHATGFAGSNEAPADRTVAMVVVGVPPTTTFPRFFIGSMGYQLAVTSTGWTMTSRDVGAAPVDRLVLTGATTEANTLFSIVWSTSASGNTRLTVQKAGGDPVTATGTGLTRGNDTEFKFGGVVYNGNTLGSLQISHVAVWDRILTADQEATALSALGNL